MERWLVVLLSTLLVICLAACAGSKPESITTADVGVQPAISPIGVGLAPPSELVGLVELQRRTSYAEEDLIRHGTEYDNGLPKMRVMPSGDAINLGAEWEQGNGLNGAAYCIYSFNVAGYDREDLVEIQWQVGPKDAELFYLGISNWDNDAWDWQQYDGNNRFQVPSLDPYFDGSDNLLVAVVYTAYNNDCSLRWVRLGDMPQPTAQLDLSAADGVAPIVASLAGYNSDPGVGDIDNFEWDFDGDGSYDSAGPISFEVHTYDTAGSFTPELRITTSYDVQATDSTAVNVRQGWEHSWGGSSWERFNDFVISGDYIYLAGNTGTWGTSNDCTIAKYGLDGTFQWAKAWGGPAVDGFEKIVTDGSGRLFAVGLTTGFGVAKRSLCLVEWSQDGIPVWEKVWEYSNTNTWNDAIYADGAIYAIGAPGSSHKPAVLAKFDLSGEVIWAREYGTPDEFLKGYTLTAVQSGGITEIHTVSEFIIDLNENGILYTVFSDEGAVTKSRLWVSPGVELTPSSICVSQLPEEVFIGARIYDVSVNDEIILLNVVDSGADIARAFTSADATTAYLNTLIPFGGYLLGAGGLAGDSIITRFSRNGLFLSGSRDDGPGTSSVSKIELIYGEGLLISGGLPSADNSDWIPLTMNSRTLSGSWSPQTISASNLTLTKLVPDAVLVTLIEDGVHDSGGGDKDAHVGLVGIP